MNNKIKYLARNWHDTCEIWNLINEFSNMTNLTYKIVVKSTIPWIGYSIYRGEFIFTRELDILEYRLLDALINNEVIHDHETMFNDTVKIKWT